MFNKAFIGASAFLVSNAQASYVLGKCPRIKTDWQGAHPSENLDLVKLQGSWSNVWESYVRQIYSECVQIRLNAIDNEPKKLQLLAGVSFKEDDQVVFDDTVVLNFNHPSDSSLAAISVSDELHGEMTDVDAVANLQSLNLPELTKEQRENLDVTDIDLYERKIEELKLLKDLITDNIRKGNRYAYPLMVLDTDYDNFLVTYQCREEFRKPTDADFMLVDGERYREVVEEYNSEKHDLFIADIAQGNHQENVQFQKLQGKILDQDNKDKLTEDDYNKEIDELMDIDRFHRHHFTAHRPTVEQWMKRRSLYAEYGNLDELDDAYNMEKEQWFNDLKISVYMRDHRSSQDQLEDLKIIIKQRVPGYDFDSFQMNSIHDDQTCLDGNIFSHAKSWRYADIDKVERKNKHTEKDIQEGKVRQGDKLNEDLEVEDVNIDDDTLESDPNAQDDEENLDDEDQDHQEREDDDMAAEEEGNEAEDEELKEEEPKEDSKEDL